MLASAPYDPVADFAPVSLLVLVPNVLVVNPELPAATVAELVDLLKADPEGYVYASSGVGTPLHLSGELFKSLTGTEMTHVPYQGSGPALQDLLGNQVSIMFDNLPSASEHIEAGTLRALGVTTLERAPSFPDVPTIAETVRFDLERGVNRIVIRSHQGLGTWSFGVQVSGDGSPEVVARLNEAALAAMADPDVASRMAEFSATIVASTPEALAAHVTAELAKWAPIVEGAGVRVE